MDLDGDLTIQSATHSRILPSDAGSRPRSTTLRDFARTAGQSTDYLQTKSPSHYRDICECTPSTSIMTMGSHGDRHCREAVDGRLGLREAIRCARTLCRVHRALKSR
jgi:hypothetical protein